MAKDSLRRVGGNPELFVILQLIREANIRSGYDIDGSLTFADAERITAEYLRLSATVEMSGAPIGADQVAPLSALRRHIRRAAPLLSRLKPRS